MRIASPHPQIYVLQNIEIMSSLNGKTAITSKILTKAIKNTISFRNIRIAFSIVTVFSYYFFQLDTS